MAGQKKLMGGIGKTRVEVTTDIDMSKLFKDLTDTVRGPTTRLAVKRAAGLVNQRYKQLLPKGKTGNLRNAVPTPGKTPVKRYETSFTNTKYVGIAGARYPAGSHAHLVEDGHEVRVSRGDRKGATPLTGSTRVPGKRYLYKAQLQTRVAQMAIMDKTVLDAIKKDGG